MTTLVVPCAGKSVRFNNRPKWAITHPHGKLLIEECISLLDLTNVSRIIFVVTKSQLEQLKLNSETFYQVFESLKQEQYEVLILDEQTSSQPETICKAIELCKIVGPISIKDSDNQFNWKPDSSSAVATKQVSQSDDIRFLQQKSFVTNENGYVKDIIEKQPMGNLICVGGYSFNNAQLFVKSFQAIKNKIKDREPFISDIISDLTQAGNFFKISEVSSYVDWGTIEIWKDYRRQFKTFFVDIDGVLLQNGSRCFDPQWQNTKPLTENIKALNAYQHAYIIVCTARPEALREITLQQLNNAGLRFDRLIMGLPHSHRILINDFNETSAPFPTASSVNIERNAEDLSRILRNL